LLSFLRRLFGNDADTTTGHDPAELRSLLDGKDHPVVIDVRQPEEFRAGHIPGAVNVPLGSLAGRAEDLARSHCAVVVVCLSDMRSRRAAAILRSSGLQKVSFLPGGTAAWRSIGYPVQRAD
jgi:rhodanese-related sulfurtransferase